MQQSFLHCTKYVYDFYFDFEIEFDYYFETKNYSFNLMVNFKTQNK